MELHKQQKKEAITQKIVMATEGGETMNPVAFQIVPFGKVVLSRTMSQKEYDAYLKGKAVSDDALFTAYQIPEGYEVANIVIEVNGQVSLNLISKN